MTSRDRVLAALNHEQPDRVPIDLSGHRSSGIAALVYPKLRQALGLEPRPVRIHDPIQQLAVVDEDVLDRFQVDVHLKNLDHYLDLVGPYIDIIAFCDGLVLLCQGVGNLAAFVGTLSHGPG